MRNKKSSWKLTEKTIECLLKARKHYLKEEQDKFQTNFFPSILHILYHILSDIALVNNIHWSLFFRMSVLISSLRTLHLRCFQFSWSFGSSKGSNKPFFFPVLLSSFLFPSSYLVILVTEEPSILFSWPASNQRLCLHHRLSSCSLLLWQVAGSFV